MVDAVLWVATRLVEAVGNIIAALSEPSAWLSWVGPFLSGLQESGVSLTNEQKEALGRFIYYGGSVEFFFAVLLIFLVILVVGLFVRPMLWRVAIGLEFFANWTGRIFAWAGLIMVLQQVMIIFLQRIFRISEITVSPFGLPFTRDLSWWSEELKLYNAAIVALCAAYTFVQGGHVRVDLFYAGLRHSAKRVIDMLGAMLFILPAMSLTWLFGWYFMWRHLVTPKINATDQLDIILRKSRLLKENIEGIGFSPNGFDQYWIFKVLLVAFAGMMFLQAWAFFYRSLLELIEGPDSANKGLDKDVLEDVTAEKTASIH
ncbi:MAG: TRAP transporter small permease subunit [Pseudomonadota bacterium]